MLLSKTAKIKWNSKIKNYYVNLGYEFTKMKDQFDVNVEHLTKYSNAIVNVKCDYCGCIYTSTWGKYNRERKTIQKDACKCVDCYEQKAKDSIKFKYGVSNIRDLNFVNEKIKQTNLSKYGCENPFGNKDVQEKIKKYYLDNYGVESAMQIPSTIEKSKNTCLEKYGVINYGIIYSREHMKELSPVWKGENATTCRDGRELPEYREWRKSIFDRDLYTCQCCGARNGNGEYIRLEAHHIQNWKDYPDKRYDIKNGVTLCQKCHLLFHSIYGKKNNNIDQLEEFKNNNFNNKDEKIC